MDRHDGFHVMEKFSVVEAILKIYRNKSGLPVMTVDQIRLPADDRKGRQTCLTEERKLFKVIVPVAIGLISPEIAFIVDKVKRNALIHIFKDTHITALSEIIHIKMSQIGHFIPVLFLDTKVLRNHDTDIEIFFIKTFRK